MKIIKYILLITTFVLFGYTSANLTENSFWNFAEYVSITRDSAEIKQIEDDYNKLWNNYSYYQVEQSVNRSVRFFARNLRRKL